MTWHVFEGDGTDRGEEVKAFDDMDSAIDYAQELNPWAGEEGLSVWVENQDGDTVYEA